jgi:hypothetical protein
MNARFIPGTRLAGVILAGLAWVPLDSQAGGEPIWSQNAADPAFTVAQAPLPSSRDALFGDDPPKSSPAKPATREQLFGDEPPKAPPPKPGSRDELFGEDVSKPRAPSKDAASVARPAAAESGLGLRGYFQTDFAYTYDNPEHWSKARARLELGRQGRLSDTVKYRVSGRVEYDAVFDIERNFYPGEVKRDQRRDFQWRETYLDVTAGNVELRLGRQHIIWGEVPGLFFADVVSARDMREFVLPEFDSLRIPQWAARAEYFAGDAHIEFVWIPWVSVDRIGRPGADFYPFPPPPPPGFDAAFDQERKPAQKLSNSNYGLRLSTLKAGWDLSAFAYRSTDIEANFYRQVIAAPTPLFLFRPRHDRITQFGGTLTKDLGEFILKAEAVYSRDKGFNVQRLSHPDGIARLDIFDYLIGADFSLGADTRLYAYGFQRRFVQYDSDIVPDRVETGGTLQLTHKFSNTLELQALFITSFNRNDWMFQPRATWNFARNWRMNVGLDILHGPQLGFFGRFGNRDRIYTNVRYSF